MSKLHLVLTAPEDLLNEPVHIQRNPLLSAFSEHRSDAVDHFAGAVTVTDDTRQSRTRLFEIGVVVAKPP
jgi:hypothetical protein